jgi:type IV pilus assembly protein PilB
LGELLISLRALTPTQLEHALKEQQAHPAPLGATLIRLGYISEELLLNALAAQLGVWPWRLEELPPEPGAVAKVPAEVCKTHKLLPVSVRGDLLLVAMINPQDLAAIDTVRNVTQMRIEPVLADPNRLNQCMERLFGETASEVAIDELVDQALKDFNVDRLGGNKLAALTEADTRPVVGLVNQILSDAIRLRASDIHVEPHRERILVRYRIDGRLRRMRELPSGILPMLTTRMKIMAELDIVETRLPQDGRISVSIDGRVVDLRVSVLPSQHGGRIVMRILDKSQGVKKLEEIGFSETNLHLFRNLVSKPYGMFLVTGPTGSGKTTTLYAALLELRNEGTNILTCEDPIEYELEGVGQSQVNEKAGLSFARQLRAILRQDPDVILVGEVRDHETAETAIRASLTGHMVLSTLHCNDALAAIPRLLDMGIEPYLLSTTLVGVMSQRLLRLCCSQCRSLRVTHPEEAALFRAYGLKAPDMLPSPGHCSHCGNTGFKGRMAVQEILPITDHIGALIAERAPIETLRQWANKTGYVPIQRASLRMVAEGLTTLEEARRVVFFDDIGEAEADVPMVA